MDSKDFAILFSTLTNLILGILILFKSNKPLNVAYALLSISVFSWGVCMILFRNIDNIENVIWATKALYAAPILIAISFLYFTYVFPPNFRRSPLLEVVYTIGAFILLYITIFTEDLIKSVEIYNHAENVISFGKFYPAYFVFILGTFLLSYYILLKKRYKATGALRKQVSYIFGATFTASFLGMMTNLILPSFGIFVLNWFGPVASVILVAIIAYAIVQHELLEVKVFAAQFLTIFISLASFLEIFTSQSKEEYFLRIVFFIIIVAISYFLVYKEILLRKDLQQKNKDLERLLKLKSEFMKVTQHQLNTPLSVMNGAFAMYKGGYYDCEKGMQIAEGAFTRMQETVNDFWSAYELEGGKLNMEKGKMPLIRIIQRQIKEKRAFISMKGEKTTIALEEPDFEVPAVYCDPQNVEHAISNLLDNAVYYAPDGTITVSIEKEGKDHLKVSIKDTGVGIDPKDQTRIFEKFVRGDRGKRQMPDGSGLGLYIAKKIMEANDGDVQLEESVPDKGTTFSLTVPIFDPEKAPEERPEGTRRQHSPVSSYHKIPDPDDDYTILLVEDETGVSKIYSDYLTSIGFSCRVADNTTDAMNIVQHEKIDAVLLDIIVPENAEGSINTTAEEGYIFLEWIKGQEQLKEIPVLVFTNLNSDQDRNKAFELGASGYIFKAYAKPQHVVRELLRSVAKL